MNSRSENSRPISRRLVLGLSGLTALSLAACTPVVKPAASPTTEAPPPTTKTATTPNVQEAPTSAFLLATLAHSDRIARINPEKLDPGAVEFLEVGAAPWGIGVHAESGVAYAATAEGLAVIDLKTFTRTALVPYQHPATSITQGEYRPGGLGLAVAPDGSAVYVATSLDIQNCFLEKFNVALGKFTGSVPVGWRPFDVVVSPDGALVTTIDHDSFSVTVVDTATLAATKHEIAPFGTQGGLGSWEKLHYGAVEASGAVLLPVQGKVVVRFDPRTGKSTKLESTANSHAHGTTLFDEQLLTVGTGSFGNADGEPNLSVLDVASGTERVAPLDVPHETVAGFSDAASEAWAAVAGGNTRNEGWEGITFVKLSDLSQRRLAVAGYPQAVVAYRA